jgi:hypothetical protein
MTNRRRSTLILCLVVAAGALALSLRAAVPARLTDQEFWRIAATFSEPSGTFHSDNLLSNEIRFQNVIPRLIETVPVGRAGRAYVGVGPEQNFTYIVALKPDIAMIVDLRRGNLDLHLMYKALFETSADRADFVSRLFSRKRPAGLSTTSTAAQIFAAYEQVPADPALYEQNLRAIDNRLTKTHGFALSADDLKGIAFVYHAFFTEGPALRYQLLGGFGRGGGFGFPTYADLMSADDGTGRQRSYLATEASYRYLKDFESRNLLVPVVGNFGGPKALRAVAAYLKQQHEIVSAFYVSDVERYLRMDGIWNNFCANTAALPLDASSTFIRSTFAAPRRGPAFDVGLAPIANEVRNCNAPN